VIDGATLSLQAYTAQFICVLYTCAWFCLHAFGLTFGCNCSIHFQAVNTQLMYVFSWSCSLHRMASLSYFRLRQFDWT